MENDPRFRKVSSLLKRLMNYFGLLVHESGQVTPLFGTEVLEVALSKFFECCLRAGYKPVDVHLRLIKSESPKFPSEICLDKNLLVSAYNLQVENYQ